jgi:hypothetical protein
MQWQPLTLSTVLLCLQTMLVLPMSPPVEKLTPSFLTDITTATKSHVLIIVQQNAAKKTLHNLDLQRIATENRKPLPKITD